MEKLTYEKPVITAVELEDADILTESGTRVGGIFTSPTFNSTAC